MRSTATIGGAICLLECCCNSPITCANSATVGAANNLRNGSSTLKLVRMRDSSCVASSECPPNSKKLSCIPTCSIFSTCVQITPNISSTGVRGAINLSWSWVKSGLGNARRSILPFGVSGNDSRTTNAFGTM